MAVNLPIITEFNGQGINKAIAEFKKLETTSEKAAFVMKKAFLPATAALAGLAAAAGPAITAASDLNETVSKTNVIFGNAAKQVLAFGDTTAQSMGISKTAALDAAATFGVFGKAAGLTGTQLATFSTDFTALAADLASFNNTTPEQAITAIGAALRGESEPIRQYGVLLSDAVLKQEAFNLGIYDGSGALTAQQKVLAAQAAIYKQTGDAQGDFERTSDGLANQQRILAASLQDTQAAIGKALLPVVQAVLPYLTKFADWAARNPKVFLAIAGTIAAVAASIVAVNVAMALNPFTAIAAGITLLVAGLVTAYNKFAWFRTGVNNLLNFLIGAFENYANIVRGAVNLIIKALNFIPGVDIPEIPEIKLGRIGGGPAGGTPQLVGENRGDMPVGVGFAPALPNIIPPAGAGGGAAGAAGRAAARAVAPAIPAAGYGPTPASAFTAESFMAAHQAMFGAGDITVNVNGGMATSAEIGESVVNALRQYNQVQGPIPVAVA
jgi:hypothetical protein